MNKYTLIAILALVTAAPTISFAQEDYADTEPADVTDTPAAQNWRQKWAQEKGAIDEAARAQYEALSPARKQAITDRMKLGLKRQQEKAGQTGEAQGRKISDNAHEMAKDASREFEEWKRGDGAKTTKYAGKAKEAMEQLQATQGSDAYHNRQKMNDFKYHHVDEAHQVQRAYHDYARDHPGVDAAADSAKDWWAKRKQAQ